MIGGFKAHDFFGDGSFYLLDSPGHAVGHLSGLARTTTNPDTFIFMGADCAHHGGALRPSPYMPIPPCLGAHKYHALNEARGGRKPDEPFFDPGLFNDLEQAKQTVKHAQVADKQDNVFFAFAHDSTLVGLVDTFPKKANEWKAKGWKEKGRWGFLKDFDGAVRGLE